CAIRRKSSSRNGRRSGPAVTFSRRLKPRQRGSLSGEAAGQFSDLFGEPGASTAGGPWSSATTHEAQLSNRGSVTATASRVAGRIINPSFLLPTGNGQSRLGQPLGRRRRAGIR